jgi:hypothetical protein
VALPDPTRRITLDLPRSKTGKPASSTICCRPCTARATRCYSRGDVAHEPDLRSRHSGWAPLSRTRQCERQPLGGPKSLVWVTGGKTRREYMFSGLPQVADIFRSAFQYLANPPQLRGARSGVEQFHARIPANNGTRLSGNEWLCCATRVHPAVGGLPALGELEPFTAKYSRTPLNSVRSKPEASSCLPLRQLLRFAPRSRT